LNNKNFLFLTLVYLNNATLGMDAPNQNPHLLESIPSCVRKSYNLEIIHPKNIKPENKQWWYLYKTIPCKDGVLSVCFNPSGTSLMMCARQEKIVVFDIEKNEITMEFDGTFERKLDCVDPSGKFVATYLAFPRSKKARIFPRIPGRPLPRVVSFKHPKPIVDISFDSTGYFLATACFDKNARIFACHEDDATSEQLQLKKAMNTWVLVEKPDKLKYLRDKDDLEAFLKMLLTDITEKQIFVPYYEQLTIYENLMKIWGTFPQNMQSSLLRTMQYKIEKHGKELTYAQRAARAAHK
jgi:WD40 repeat protein